ncbi:MAG TPA: hypothetical protein IAC04_02460 [Candidatus Coprenecus stercoravium]|uniref:Uncharacterized protein n=1 Tax=Candidatus Coprenecus stercoravium TaxID=2840735 RepID=A0A9D2GQD0_9BACT|nr:hypothetical protein [Candidatus Coprenecus stercoravium]
MLNWTRLIFSTILLLALLPVPGLHAQYFTLGSDPSRAEWRQLTSRNYRLVYPAETDSIARVYLYTLENVRPVVMSQLNIDPDPIPVILHPYTTQSNGVVTWAPKRIDLFSSPDPYGSNPDAWIRHLTIHESRHVGQVEHFTKGIYRVFYYLLGEQVTGLGLGLFASTYAMEGDAVIAETQLTGGGRGRNADFTKYLRAMYINGDFRNWDRLQFGSYRHYTPNEYVFGYVLGSYVRYRTGLADYIGKYFNAPVRYWYDLKLAIDPGLTLGGSDRNTVLAESQRFYSNMWRQDYLSRGQFTSSNDLRDKPDRLYTEYSDPIYITCPGSPWDGHVLTIKKGMETAPKIVALDSTGKEHFIRFFAGTSSRLTYDGHSRIYWSETVSNEASPLEDFSVVSCLDLLSGRTMTHKHRSKYFNPAPSVTGDTLAVAEYPVGGPTYLTLITASEHDVIRRIKAPENGQIRESVFDGPVIYSTVITDSGIGIFRYEDGKWSETAAPQRQSISGLKLYGRSLYFSSDLDGVLNIYRYSPGSGELVRVTNSEYGADYPWYDTDGGLYYCEYGLKGYRPVHSGAGELLTDSADFTAPFKFPMAEYLTAQSEKFFPQSQSDTTGKSILDAEKYPSRKYSKLLHMFRLHSWFPVYVNINRLMSFTFDNFTETASAGVTLLSQNSLGNVISTAGYGYVRDPYTGGFFHSGHITMDAQILGNLSVELGLDVNNRNAVTNAYDLSLGTQFWKENRHTPLISARASVYYPLSLNSRGWYRSLTPYITWQFNNDRYYSYTYSPSHGGIQAVNGTPVMRHILQYGISYTQTLSTATSQIFPRWGFGISLSGVSPLSTLHYFGHYARFTGYVYMPGITPQQGIRLGLSAQKQFTDGKLFVNAVSSLPRGYTGTVFDEAYASTSLDYAVPIYLGDVSLGPILYLKRLQLIPFGDFAAGMTPGTGGLNLYYSYGTDLKLDFYIFRLNFPISAGVRYARTGPQTGPRNYFGLLFEISFT